MLPQLAAQTGHLLWRARMLVAGQLAETLPSDVDVHAFAALHVLGDGTPRSQQALAEATAVSRTTAGAVARDLVAQGYVERVRDTADRRSWLLTALPAGSEAVRRWAGHLDAVTAALTTGLDEAEHAELVDLLARAVDPLVAETVPPELRARAGFLVVRLHEHVHREVMGALDALDLEPRHLGSLTALTAAGPVAQADLARHLGLSAARVVRLVDDLESRGLLERRAAPGDRRTHLLHLTPDAAAVLPVAAARAGAVLDRVLAMLTTTERERLRALLESLVAHGT